MYDDKKDKFTFKRSYYEAMNDLKDSDKILLLNAICEYALNENEVELEGLPLTLFKLIKAQIDKK